MKGQAIALVGFASTLAFSTAYAQYNRQQETIRQQQQINQQDQARQRQQQLDRESQRATQQRERESYRPPSSPSSSYSTPSSSYSTPSSGTNYRPQEQGFRCWNGQVARDATACPPNPKVEEERRRTEARQRLDPDFRAAVERANSLLRDATTDLARPNACSEKARASFSTIERDLTAKWNVARWVQSEPSNAPCARMCESLARAGSAICAGDSAHLADKPAHWKTASEFSRRAADIGSHGCACDTQRSGMQALVQSRLAWQASNQQAISAAVATRQEELRASKARQDAEAARAKAALEEAQRQKAEAAKQQSAALVAQAAALVREQRHAAAVPLLRQAAALDSNQIEAARMLPEALRRLAPPDVRGAYGAYDDLVRRFPSDAQAKVAFGHFLVDLGRWQEAERMVFLAEHTIGGREVRARAFAGANNYSAALSELNIAMRMPEAAVHRQRLDSLAAEIARKNEPFERVRIEARRKVDVEGRKDRQALVASVRREYGPTFEDPALADFQRLDATERQARMEAMAAALRAFANESIRLIVSQSGQRPEGLIPRLMDLKERCHADDPDICTLLSDELARTSTVVGWNYSNPLVRAGEDARLLAYRLSCAAGFLDSCESLALGLKRLDSSEQGPTETWSNRALGHFLSLCELRRAGCVAVGNYFAGTGDFIPRRQVQRKLDERRAVAFYEAMCRTEPESTQCGHLRVIKRGGLAALSKPRPEPEPEVIALWEAAGHFNQGRNHYMGGNFKESISRLQRAVQLKPEKEAYVRFLGEALVRSGDPRAGVAHISKAIDLSPKDPWLYLSLADALGETRDKNAAVRAIERATTLEPQNAWIHLFGAQVLARIGEKESALRAAEKALAVDPEDRYIQRNRSALLARFEATK